MAYTHAGGLQRPGRSGSGRGRVSPRPGNHHCPPPFTERYDERIYACWAVNVRALQRHNIRFRMPLLEDFDVHLKLIAASYALVQIYEFAASPRSSSNSDGGCSLIRTTGPRPQLACNELARLHPPGVVRVVQKKATSWGNGMTTRMDVVLHLKKAVKLAA